ncbi:MAG: transglycosylase SLT domain-containing protein [Ferruginibacter sp.]|nr:transglycosylase SLT domain-containing protein [Cytophagales bacterium]
MIPTVKPNAFVAAVAGLFIFLSHFSVPGQTVESGEKTPENVPALADTTARAHPDSARLAIFLPEHRVPEPISCRPASFPMRNNQAVRGFVRRFTVTGSSFVTTMLQRKRAYFPLYEEQLRKHCLPDELKYLSIVESALNPKAVSPVRAAGLWQFMPATGRQYQLHQDAYIDERMDPTKATEAACRYLKDLYGMFNDWELALAAYNCGPGNVRRAIRRSGNQTSFWKIHSFLPPETRAYVPKFMAVASIMTEAARHDLTADSLVSCVPDTIVVRQSLDMARLAQQLGISPEELRALNPHVKRNVLPGYYSREYTLRIPAETKEFFALNRSSILDSASVTRKTVSNIALVAYAGGFSEAPVKRKIVYTVNRGDVLGSIANRYGVRVADIKQWNHLKSDVIRVGQRLAIWKKAKPAVKVALVANSAQATDGPYQPAVD